MTRLESFRQGSGLQQGAGLQQGLIARRVAEYEPPVPLDEGNPPTEPEPLPSVSDNPRFGSRRRGAPSQPEYNPLSSQPQVDQDPEVVRRVLENQAVIEPMLPSPEDVEWRSQQDLITTGDILRGIGVEGAQSLSRTAKNISHTVTHPEDLVQLLAHPSKYDDIAKLWWQNVRENPMDTFADLATGAALTFGTGALGAVVAGPTRRVLQVSGHADEARLLSRVNAPDAPRVNAPDAPRAAANAPTGRAGVVGRIDARLEGRVERRLQRRSNFAPTNVGRRVLGLEQRDLRYGRAARMQTRFANWVGGDSPSAIRQYAKQRLTRDESFPEFPEGTNTALRRYEEARWRNQEVMRPVNRVRRGLDVAEDLENAAEFLADPWSHLLPFLSEKGQNAGAVADEGVGFKAAKQQSEPYVAGRGFRKRKTTLEVPEEALYPDEEEEAPPDYYDRAASSSMYESSSPYARR
jgi:hypothetical protein